jgi:hypothetical protein
VPVNEHDRHFVIELAAEFGVGVNVDLLPGKPSAPRKLGQTLFYQFTEMTSLAGVNNHISGVGHAGILARRNRIFPVLKLKRKDVGMPFWEV